MNIRSFISVLAAILVGTMFLTGCPPKKKLPIEERVEATPTPEVSPTPIDETANDIKINQEWAEISPLSTISFDFNSAQLNDAARATLKANVAIIKKLPSSVTLRVEGHTDDRGTVEYNIALGQRRADVVRSFYVTSGVGKSRLKTISFGEERPLCNFQTEDCWAQNRRASTTLRNDTPLSIDPSSLQ